MLLAGVIFDMDGVLCDSEPLILAAAQAMFRQRYGLEVPEEDFRPFIGTGEDRYLGGPAAQHGVTIDLPAAKKLTYDLYLELIRGRLQALPGSCAFVRRCQSAGLRTAVASAADLRKVQGNLAELGLPPASFTTVVTGSDVERKKPHPEAFLLAASRLGLPAPQCLVIEDALNGLAAATAAGCPSLALITSFPAERLATAHPTWMAADLSQVPAACLQALGLE